MPVRCSVFIAVSLDGFIARADGSIDWLGLVEVEGEDYGYRPFLYSVDTLVIGRKTYEMALKFPQWPYVGKRCVVLSSARVLSSHGESFFAGTPKELMDKLDAEGAKHVYVDGGAVIQQFVAAGLVTEMTISIVPLLLGEGVPLFGNAEQDVRLELISSKAFASGLVQLRYRVPGPRA
jgi:dihydrofolate reductase